MSITFEKSDEKEQDALVFFLKHNLYYHTFILSDLYYYGFDKAYQEIYAEKEDGRIKAVFLRYFTNLILAGNPEEESCREIWRLVGEQINTIMGSAEIVKKFSGKNSGITNEPSIKQLYIMEDHKQLDCGTEKVYTAEEMDIDKIYDFLMTVPEFQSIYGEKDMIRNRISNKEGEHLYYMAEGEIIAHTNTAAETPWACMIGGVAVKPEYQHQGIGHRIVSSAAKRALEKGQMPTVFSECEEEHNLFCDLGFRRVGNWGVLNITKKITG